MQVQRNTYEPWLKTTCVGKRCQATKSCSGFLYQSTESRNGTTFCRNVEMRLGSLVSMPSSPGNSRLLRTPLEVLLTSGGVFGLERVVPLFLTLRVGLNLTSSLHFWFKWPMAHKCDHIQDGMDKGADWHCWKLTGLQHTGSMKHFWWLSNCWPSDCLWGDIQGSA